MRTDKCTQQKLTLEDSEHRSARWDELRRARAAPEHPVPECVALPIGLAQLDCQAARQRQGI